MLFINASHLGQWAYCNKQYHLAVVRGMKPNKAARLRMEKGTRAHQKHGRRVSRTRALARVQNLLYIAAALLILWMLLTSNAYTLEHVNQIANKAIIGLIPALIIIAWILSRIRRQLGALTGLPTAGQIIMADTNIRTKRPIHDRQLGLKGKPDYAIRQRASMFSTRIVAAEVKPTREADHPYPGDKLQALAYVHLLRTKYPRTAMPFGYLAYKNKTFPVNLDRAGTELLQRTIATMRASHSARDIPRNHASPGKCRGCGFADRCNESLA